MIALLNRICWWIAIALWIWITFVFTDNLNAIFIGMAVGIFIKQLFFPREYIEQRVENFAAVLLQRQQNPPTTLEKPIKQYEEPDEEESIEEDLSIIEKTSTEKDVIIPNRDTSGDIDNQEEDIMSKFLLWIQGFFSENILAKIWGIFVFLGVIFLLSLVWDTIPGIWKILLWFSIWMASYITWILFDRKWIDAESRILMWIWILINYAVILSWKYLIWETSIDTTPIFSTGISFFFLIANTLFAIATALYYKSDILLIFAFLFAYINPLLIGYTDTTPYLNVWYAMIISIGALFLAQKKSDLLLLLWAFFLWNIFILQAPVTAAWNIEAWYMTKYIASVALSLLSIFSAIKMSYDKKNIVEIVLWWSFFFIATFNIFSNTPELTWLSFIITAVASFIFMWVSYFYINKWNYLYSIGSIWGAVILWSHIIWDNYNLIVYYILAICIYAFLNIFSVFYLQVKTDTSLKNLILWSLSWALFLGLSFLWAAKLFDRDIEFSGILYTLFALIYFLVAFLFHKKTTTQENKEDFLQKYVCYNYLAIAISFLSLWVALIFSDYSYITSLFWLFEAVILLFLYNKIWDKKIALAWLILMWLWVMKWYTNLWTISNIYEYIFPASLWFLILAVSSLSFKEVLKKENNDDVTNMYSYIHIILLIWVLMWIIIGISGTFSPTKLSANIIFIILWILFIPLAYFYKVYGSNIQKSWFSILYGTALISHIVWFISYWQGEAITIYTGLFQYGITTLFVIAGFLFISPLKAKTPYTDITLVSSISYLFIISSFYVYNIFPNIFTLTIYWAIIAFCLISRWIWKDIISLRTLWLYLLAFVCAKVFFIDISSWISNPIIKISAFIGVWVLFIIIGTMYSKKYGNKLKWEFELSNIFWWTASLEIDNNSEKTETINTIIDSVDIKDISSISFKPTWEKAFTTKSKNLIKIVKKIMWAKQEAEFAPKELLSDYNYIVKNYKSSLNKTELWRVQGVIKSFVDTGGKVSINNNK